MPKVMKRWQFYLLSFIWGFDLSFLGAILTGILMLCGKTVVKNQYGYACLIGKHWGGFTLGPFTFVCEDADEDLLAHEFGHSLQNCYFGNFQVIITLMSAVRWWWRHIKKTNLPAYDSIWFEGTATYLGNYYSKVLNGYQTN